MRLDLPPILCIASRSSVPPLTPAPYAAYLLRLVAGGIRFIQLREKTLSITAMEPIARNVTSTLLEAAPDALVVVNGNVSNALTWGCAGSHLPEAIVPESARRCLIGGLMGCSVHSVESAKRAADAGADYIVYSPIFRPSTKDTPGVGLRALEKVVTNVPTPVFALGGITPERVASCLSSGAYGVAALSGLMTADPERTAKKYQRSVAQWRQSTCGVAP